MIKKWYIYQKERFPLVQYIPLMFIFGFCSVSYSIHLDFPDAKLTDVTIFQYVAAAVTTLFWFLLLRIADEHKDFEEDSKYRPYRPIQRGLIKLKELRVLGIALGIIQVLMAVFIDIRLIFMLALVYLWYMLMCKEFFVSGWLKSHHTVYLLSHMIIMPFIDLYATSVEWVPRGGVFSFGLLVHMISSFCDGTVVEVGRKLRAPENEEYGVDTYTQIWGPKRAMFVWLLCVTISLISTILEGFQVRVGIEMTVVLSLMYCYALFAAIRFAKSPTSKNAKVFTVFPGVWMMLNYFILGILPYFK